ncbi:hypothetical protein AMATHDRAFT_65768 [Amanita thiersii Skay4041]|uniref:Uncharacterized protein n=1 Tax=Amanita thiersii Skay4041 TaxID=703135 RepID=A0A2A9NB94_9AGAR|nr:hypothetical protein AMATHDRAFT_65768 [Amanita thiersii Skay4041]
MPPHMNIRNAPPSSSSFTAPPPVTGVSSIPIVSAAAAAASTSSQPLFKAPAHKHAHHLHSIPPREKSTRTLIIDHMLWVHGRTRFAQARAELGMTDRTGGPPSPNYTHRRRPENYEEDDEVGSEGEDTHVLKARIGGAAPQTRDEDERMKRQDLPLARSLRLRAEGLEKVVTSMLDQPPPIHPIDDDDIPTTPTSPKSNQSTQRNGPHPHTLPNGVRLRLGLGTIINDLFARQAPHPTYRHTHPHTPGSSSMVTNKPLQSTSEYSSIQAPNLPSALAVLSSVSGASFIFTDWPSSSTSSPEIPSTPSQIYPSVSTYPSHLHNDSSQLAYSPFPQQPPGTPQHVQRRISLPPNQRIMSLYLFGADPQTAHSPPNLRCPRHLHTGCEICVEAKSTGIKPATSTNANTYGAGAGGVGVSSHIVRGRPTSSARDIPGGFRAINIPNTSGAFRGLQNQSSLGPNRAASGGGISGWQDESGIGSGLLRPGVKGCALRRKVKDLDPTTCFDEGLDGATGAGNTKLSKLIPRFLRLSALVVVELGREAREEEEEGSEGDTFGTKGEEEQKHIIGSPNSQAESDSESLSRLFDIAFRPTRQWYMLLAGLLTRAVLEGYLTAGWRGFWAVECLLTVGLGLQGNPTEEEDVDDEFQEFDPDDLPSLTEAVRLLFPSLRNGVSGSKTMGEEEYEIEMFERLRRFYDVPPLTPDLATHMEDLAWQYPAEPVERAAVRFCEAVARWRGKPELETYKNKPPPGVTSTPRIMMESFVRSNPTSPTVSTIPNSGIASHQPIGVYPNESGAAPRRVKQKPSIDVYFTHPNIRPELSRAWAGIKRPRSPSDIQKQGSPPKRLRE